MSLLKNSKIGISVALAAAIGVMILGGLSLERKVETFRDDGLVVTEGADRQLTIDATDAVLHPELARGDQVLLVDGETPASPAALRRALAESPSSEMVVLRGGEVREVLYTRPPLAIDWSYLVQAFIGGVYLLIGLYTILRQRGRQSTLFYLWCLCSSFFYLLVSTPTSLLVIDGFGRATYVLEEVARLLLPPLTLHFFLSFPRALRDSGNVGRLVPFLYLPSAVLAFLQADLIWNRGQWLFGSLSPQAMGDAIRLLERLGLLLIVVYAIAGAGFLLYQAARTAERDEREEKRQLLWIALGTGFGYTPFIVFYLIPWSLGIQGPALLDVLAVLPLAIVPLSFAYAILRYRLWDITIIGRDVTTYTLTLLFGVAGFSMLRLFIERGVPEGSELSRNLLTVLSALLVGGLLVPTRHRVGSALERAYYRGGFSQRRTLANLGKELLGERDLKGLCTLLLEQLEAGLSLEKVNLFLAEANGLTPVRSEDDELPPLPSDAFSEHFWSTDIELLSGIALPEAAASPAQRLFVRGYRYAFPLTVRDRRVGFVACSDRLGDTPLSSEDEDLMRQILNQAALAIENAHLVARLQQQLTEVQELRQYNEGIIEASPAGIAVLDSQDRIVSANLAFAALAGIDQGTVRRRALSELLPVERAPRPTERPLEIEIEGARGEYHLQLSSADFASGEAGDLKVLVVTDITERVAMERALEEKGRLAALGVMAAGIAHEVNTPLTGISSYAQMLLETTPDNDPRHDLLRKVERQTFRASGIVNNLLSLARSRSQSPQALDFELLIGEITELLAEGLRSNDVELEIHIEDGLTVHACAGELQQVLTNLCSNAIEAMEGEGGRLRITGIHRDGSIEVAIEDNGPGIPDAIREKVFEPFFSTKNEQGGTGLGLSISAEIVRRNHGELRIEDTTDSRGCRFVIELPEVAREGAAS